MKVYPNVKLMMGISVPGMAEAERQAGRKDVDVILLPGGHLPVPALGQQRPLRRQAYVL